MRQCIASISGWTPEQHRASFGRRDILLRARTQFMGDEVIWDCIGRPPPGCRRYAASYEETGPSFWK
jgi:hypothetical protein